MLPVSMEDGVCDAGVSSTQQHYQKQQQLHHHATWLTSSPHLGQQQVGAGKRRRSRESPYKRGTRRHMTAADSTTTGSDLSADDQQLHQPHAMSYVDQVTQWLNEQTCDGTVKRRRKVSRHQRVAANHRERRRMRQLNVAFDQLRAQIPAAVSGERTHRPLSRIQTLRLAIDYIAFMMNTLDSSTQSDELGSQQYEATEWQQVTAGQCGEYTDDELSEMKPHLIDYYQMNEMAQQAANDFVVQAPSAVFDNDSSVNSNISYTSLQPL